MSDDMWTRCMLDGAELDAAVARLLCIPVHAFSTDWAHGGPLIESNQIFIDPPRDVHINGGPNSGWTRFHQWTATVSSRTRTFPNPFSPVLPEWVGRGTGPTPLVAAMRAIVASFGEQP